MKKRRRKRKPKARVVIILANKKFIARLKKISAQRARAREPM